MSSDAANVVALPRLAVIGKVTQMRVVVSEWTKLHSLRSTRWSLLVAVVLTIGLPLLFATIVGSHWAHMRPQERANRHPLDIALAGVNLSQLAIAVLGVLIITGEYSTGMIRASMTAVPKRLPVLWAKLGVFAVVTFVLMLPSVFLAFWGSQAILNQHHILQISLSHPGVAAVGGRRCAVPRRARLVRAGDRCDRPQHRGRDRDLRGDLLRHPAADERPADELEQRDLEVPSGRGRP